MTREQNIVQAREDADRARERMALTLAELRQRLAPKTLLNGAWHEVRDRGQDLAGEAIQVVRTRPVATSAVAAAVIAFVAREPLWRALNAILPSRRGEQPKADESAAIPSIPDTDSPPGSAVELVDQHKEVA